MIRKYGGEFLDELERKNMIGSYCAEDSNYIQFLERKLTEARSKRKAISSFSTLLAENDRRAVLLVRLLDENERRAVLLAKLKAKNFRKRKKL